MSAGQKARLWGLLIAAGILTVVAFPTVRSCWEAPRREPRPETKELHALKQLRVALSGYEARHRAKPPRLVDLIPTHLTKSALLISPVNQLPYEYHDPPLQVKEYRVIVVRQLSQANEVPVHALCEDNSIRVLAVEDIRSAGRLDRTGR